MLCLVRWVLVMPLACSLFVPVGVCGQTTTITATGGPPALTLTNSGKFDNAQYYQYATWSIGGCSNTGLYTNLNGGNETVGLSSCIQVPSTATQRQSDAIAGMVDNYAGQNSPAVGVFGGGACHSTNCRIWGANFLVSDNGFSTFNAEGVEIDSGGANSSSTPVGLDIANYFTVPISAGFAVSISSPNFATQGQWPLGIYFQTGATPATDFNHAAIRFNPVSSTSNQESQGMQFYANAPGSGTVFSKLRLLPNDAIDITNQVSSGSLSLNGGNPVTSFGAGGVTASAIASGTATMTTAAIASGACGSSVTVAANRVATTDVIEVSNNASVSTPNGLLIINKWVTTGNVNFAYCNPTASSQTPVAATLNWAVHR